MSVPPDCLLILHGPNLNLLGTREPDRYGTDTLADANRLAEEAAAQHGFDVQCLQSNSEGVLINAIHAAAGTCSGVILNAGGLTHTSVALRDALLAVGLPFAEVHITNVHAREPFRHHSYLSDVAHCVIVGAGIRGYGYAVDALIAHVRSHDDSGDQAR